LRSAIQVITTSFGDFNIEDVPDEISINAFGGVYRATDRSKLDMRFSASKLAVASWDMAEEWARLKYERAYGNKNPTTTKMKG
jgi:hypothetical protein